MTAKNKISRDLAPDSPDSYRDRDQRHCSSPNVGYGINLCNSLQRTLKSLRLLLAFSLALIVMPGCHSQSINTLSAKEKGEGWKLLFDGKTTTGWHNFNKDKIGTAWKVTDGVLYLDISNKDGGDIVTDKEYENYEFSTEWMIAPCGNSGIIFNAVESPNYKSGWNTGPEMQVLDNACHPDAKIKKHRAGNLYDLIESPIESVKPANEWNLAKIIFNKGHLELWLNDVKQVETTMFTPQWEAMIKGSKFKDIPDFGKSRKGHIMLQDHGNKVSFKNIKIKELK